MRYTEVKMPVKMKITGRSSTITNSFVSSIIPSIEPKDEEIRECLRVLGIDPNDLLCVYCGDRATEWDHFRPLVVGKKPTGYISEIKNLVPSCGKCNQSKGNKKWKTWILSNARNSPKVRKIEDLPLRIKRLEEYEEWGKTSPIDFAGIVDDMLWSQHWQNCANLQKEMKRCQDLADKLKIAIEDNLENRN